MAFVASLVIQNVDFGLSGVENYLGVFFETYFLSIVFVQVKLETLDFLGCRQRLMGRLGLIVVIENLFVSVSFEVFQEQFAFHFLQIFVDYAGMAGVQSIGVGYCGTVLGVVVLL